MNYLYSHVRIVAVHPSVFVTILNGTASYMCATSGVTNDVIVVSSVQWLVNGRLVQNHDNVVVTATGELKFLMISRNYNRTSIRCRATLTSGSVVTSIKNGSLLLIQGVFFQIHD